MGLALGFAFLAKYTALLGALGLGVALYTATIPVEKYQRTPHRNRRSLWISSLGNASVILWNAQRGWPTIEHLLGHLHVPGGDNEPPHGSSISDLDSEVSGKFSVSLAPCWVDRHAEKLFSSQSSDSKTIQNYPGVALECPAFTGFLPARFHQGTH